MASAYYNERDPFAAEWLRRLIAERHIPAGFVDERDIRDVQPVELAGFRQCHFFAGVGVWALALRRAGWPDDRPVWTGSCPCQPFSAAGKRAGIDDERHLWPHWFHLIAQHGPDAVLGEQVASKDGLGWLDLVSSDLEGAGYAFAASDLCAAGFGGAHIRQRLYFVGLADAHDTRLEGRSVLRERAAELAARSGSVAGRLAHPDGGNAGAERQQRGGQQRQQPQDGGDGGVGDTESLGRIGRQDDLDSRGWERPPGQASEALRTSAPLLGRDAADWLYCTDGKWRPVEPGTFPLADAAPNRVGRLRAYGNALDLETATGFVEAVMECAAVQLGLAA